MILDVAILTASYTAALGVTMQVCAALRVLPTRTADAWTMCSALVCLISCNVAVLDAGGSL